MKVDYILGLLLLIGGENATAFVPVQRRKVVVVEKRRTTTTTTTTTSLNLDALEQKTPDYEETTKMLQSYGEKSRIYRRNIFTAADWVKNRSSDRFVSNILTTFNSGLLRQLQPELTFIMAVSAFIVFYNDVLIDGYSDLSGMQHPALVDFVPALQLPIVPFSLSSGALGLLLAFRTNVSYSRWNEARTAWGKVVNDSRSIARMACIWSKSYKNIDDQSLQRLGDAICSFGRSLMNRTLPPQEDEQNFIMYTHEQIGDQNYAQVLRTAKHRPSAALAELTSTIVDFRLNPLHQVEVEHAISGLCDALGASERIFTSPVPTFYSRHTARFLSFWLLALPMGLYAPLSVTWNHWVVIPVTVFIGGFLLGIDELATQMEEPFSILPMELMCKDSIRISIMEQVERSQKGIQSPYYGEGFPFLNSVIAHPYAAGAAAGAAAANGQQMNPNQPYYAYPYPMNGQQQMNANPYIANNPYVATNANGQMMNNPYYPYAATANGQEIVANNGQEMNAYQYYPYPTNGGQEANTNNNGQEMNGFDNGGQQQMNVNPYAANPYYPYPTTITYNNDGQQEAATNKDGQMNGQQEAATNPYNDAAVASNRQMNFNTYVTTTTNGQQGNGSANKNGEMNGQAPNGDMNGTTNGERMNTNQYETNHEDMNGATTAANKNGEMNRGQQANGMTTNGGNPTFEEYMRRREK
eukprot:scaffold5918_cov130-Cylindrotheca_fusiformis.AAC.5